MAIRKKKSICHDQNRPFYQMMKAYEEAGVTLTMEGERMSADAIADACEVRESGSYMLDFVPDASGEKVQEIRLDKISDVSRDSPSVSGRRI